MDAAGRNVSAPLVALTTQEIRRIALASGAVKVDVVTGVADAEFRYDAKAGGSYVRNLSTVGLASGLYEVTFVAAGDPVPHKVRFILW